MFDLFDFYLVQDGEVERVFVEVVRGQFVNEVVVQIFFFVEVGQFSELIFLEVVNCVSYRQGGEGGGFCGGWEMGDRGYCVGRFIIVVMVKKFFVN